MIAFCNWSRKVSESMMNPPSLIWTLARRSLMKEEGGEPVWIMWEDNEDLVSSLVSPIVISESWRWLALPLNPHPLHNSFPFKIWKISFFPPPIPWPRSPSEVPWGMTHLVQEKFLQTEWEGLYLCSSGEGEDC